MALYLTNYTASRFGAIRKRLMATDASSIAELGYYNRDGASVTAGVVVYTCTSAGTLTQIGSGSVAFDEYTSGAESVNVSFASAVAIPSGGGVVVKYTMDGVEVVTCFSDAQTSKQIPAGTKTFVVPTYYWWDDNDERYYYGVQFGGGLAYTNSTLIEDAATSAPAAPTSFTATAGSVGIDLAWTKPAGAITGNKVYRNTTNNSGTATLIATIGDVAAFNDPSVPTGSTRYYWVRAYNAIGDGMLSSVASASATTAPSADATRFTATNVGDGVELLWATDPAVVPTAHRVWKNGLLLTTPAIPTVYYKDAAGASGDVYVVRASEGGRALTATAKAVPTLTLGSYTPTSVPCSWTTPSGASMRLVRSPWGPRQHVMRHVICTGGESYTDTSPIDGNSQYIAVATFADGQRSESLPQTVRVVTTKYISPPERDQAQHFDENLGAFICGHKYPPSWETIDGDYQIWLEDHGESAWMMCNLPLSFSKYAAISNDFTLDHVNKVPLMRVQLNSTLETVARGDIFTNDGSPDVHYKPSLYDWNGNVGHLFSSVLRFTWDVSASTAGITAAPGSYEVTATCGGLHLASRIGGTTTHLGSFTTKTFSVNPITDTATLEVEKVVSGVTCHFTIKFIGGTITASGWMSGHATGDCLLVGEVLNTDKVTQYSDHLITQQSFGSGGNRMAPTGRICYGKKLNGAGSFSGSLIGASFDGVSNGVSVDIAKFWFGVEPYPNTYHDEITEPLSDHAIIGGPVLPSRALLGVVVSAEIDAPTGDGKTKLVDFVDTVCDNATAMQTQFDAHELGLSLWAAKSLDAVFPGEGWDTRATSLRSALGSSYGTNTLAAAGAAYGLRTYGDTTAALAALTAYPPTASDPQYLLGYALMGRPNIFDTTGLAWLSYLLRGMRSQSSTHWNGDMSVVWGTGEATGWCIAALGRYSAQLGGIMPILAGRSDYTVTSAWMTNAYKSDGLITALAWNGTDTLTATVDRDIWFYTATHGKPTSVKAGATELTEVGTDPGTTPLTNGTYYFDDTVNVLKVGVTSTSNLTLVFAAQTLTLSAGTPTMSGIPLSWENWIADGFIGWDVKEGTTLIQRLTSATASSYTVAVADGASHTYTVTLVTAYDETVSNAVTVTAAAMSFDGAFNSSRLVSEPISGAFTPSRNVFGAITGSLAATRVVSSVIDGMMNATRTVAEAFSGTLSAKRLVSEPLAGTLPTHRLVLLAISGTISVIRFVKEVVTGALPTSRRVSEPMAGTAAATRLVGEHVAGTAYVTRFVGEGIAGTYPTRRIIAEGVNGTVYTLRLVTAIATEPIEGSFAASRYVSEGVNGIFPAVRVVDATPSEVIEGICVATRIVTEGISGSAHANRRVLEGFTADAPATRLVGEQVSGTMNVRRTVAERLGGVLRTLRQVIAAPRGYLRPFTTHTTTSRGSSTTSAARNRTETRR